MELQMQIEIYFLYKMCISLKLYLVHLFVLSAYFYRTQVYLESDLWIQMSLSEWVQEVFQK